tara:strand:+ start:1109 stop:1297 length:189 start_codon:yes stop_codon:yes gene_type:complete
MPHCEAGEAYPVGRQAEYLPDETNRKEIYYDYLYLKEFEGSIKNQRNTAWIILYSITITIIH